MKTTKRITGIILALALALSLALPAFAADPIITGITPQNAKARTGQSITFTVEAQPPEGAEGPLAYQWYELVDGEWEAIEGATSKTLTVTGEIEDFVSGFFSSIFNVLLGLKKEYRAVVSNGEGEALQEISAVFFPSFIDGSRSYLLMTASVTVNFLSNIIDIDSFDLGMDWEDIIQIAMIPLSIIVFPMTVLAGIIIWLTSSLVISRSI